MQAFGLLSPNKFVSDLSNEILYILVSQRAKKLQTIKVLEATFFAMLCGQWLLIRSPGFDLDLQFCRPLTYRDSKYLFGKVEYILIDMKKLKSLLTPLWHLKLHTSILLHKIQNECKQLSVFVFVNNLLSFCFCRHCCKDSDIKILIADLRKVLIMLKP